MTLTKQAIAKMRDSGVPEEILWCVAPSVETSFAGTTDVKVQDAATPGERLRRAIRDRASQLRRRRVAGIDIVDGVLFGWDTVNQRRTLSPLMGALGDGRDPGSVWRPRLLPRRLAGVVNVYVALEGEFPRSMDQAFADASSLGFLLGRAESDLETARHTVSELSPECVVVASQQGVLARALGMVAAEHGIPSIYFPHAPLADVPWYHDLPFDYVGLRGPGEVEVASKWAGDAEGLRGVGHVSGHEERFPTSLDSSLAVLALSPASGESLERLFHLVREVGIIPVVAVHPRQRRAEIRRMLPSGWSLSQLRSTQELLDQGPAVVLQSSSGIGLEAMRRGIPVIDVRTRGDQSVYLYLDSEVIRTARDAATLDREFKGALEDAGSDVQRSKLIEAAEYWDGPSGTEAVSAGVQLIADARTEGSTTRNALLDRWSHVLGKAHGTH